MTEPRTLTDRQLKALGKRLHTDAGMAELMDGCFGPDGWAYEAPDDLWIAPDRSHSGGGRAFFVVRRGGDWIKSILPERVLS